DAPAADNYEYADPHARFGEVPTGTGMGMMTEAGDVATKQQVRVAFLRGCVQDGLFSRVNDATLRVLRANGCEVVDVPEQACCGALHAHSGELDKAHDLARRNIEA